MRFSLTAGPVGRTALGMLATAMLLTACGSDNGAKSTQGAPGSKTACAAGNVSGAGSTFQQNIEQQWIADYGSQCSGAKVNYQGTGSGAGIEQFGAGTIDFAGSDVTMKPDQQRASNARCGSPAIQVPVTAGGIAVIYHLAGVRNLQLSAKTLAGIFQGEIKKWDDPAVTADNPGAKLPATPISAYHRSDGSGTTSVFSAFLAADARPAWRLGSGTTLQWPAGAGQAAKGSDGVTAGVKQSDGGITYAEVSFAKANGLPTARVAGTGGSFVDLTGDSVAQAVATGFSVTGTGNDLGGTIEFSKVAGYPISTVSYAIVCQHYADMAKGRSVAGFLTYAVTGGQRAADSLGFAALPAAVADKSKASVASVS